MEARLEHVPGAQRIPAHLTLTFCLRSSNSLSWMTLSRASAKDRATGTRFLEGLRAPCADKGVHAAIWRVRQRQLVLAGGQRSAPSGAAFKCARELRDRHKPVRARVVCPVLLHGQAAFQKSALGRVSGEQDLKTVLLSSQRPDASGGNATNMNAPPFLAARARSAPVALYS